MASRPEDFSAKVREAVAKRAAYICSRPGCGAVTIQAHSSDPMGYVATGIAAHICAAKPEGPRYDENQTHEERTSIGNAIWLCAPCSMIIDKDIEKHPKELLISWRVQHELALQNNGSVPSLPAISVATLAGISLPSVGPFVVNINDTKIFREHKITVKNVSQQLLQDITMRLQFPEPILEPVNISRSAGTDVLFSADRTEWMVGGTGGTVVKTGDNPAMCFKFQLSQLFPGREISIQFKAIPPRPPDPLITQMGGYQYHITGSFHYQQKGYYLARELLTLINYEPELRKVSSLPCEEDDGTKRIWITQEG